MSYIQQPPPARAHQTSYLQFLPLLVSARCSASSLHQRRDIRLHLCSRSRLSTRRHIGAAVVLVPKEDVVSRALTLLNRSSCPRVKLSTSSFTLSKPLIRKEMFEDSLDLKVRELLEEVRLDHSSAITELVDQSISAIKSAINRIPEDLQVTADLAPGFVRDVGADKVEFKFKKPTFVQIGGSYSICCVAKPDVSVDLFIRLPKECFLEKDYLNHRYHAKRCLYLCVIKKYLKLSSSFHKIEWATLQNEARKPLLVVYPGVDLGNSSDFCLRIIPTATSLFNIKKLNLDRNNVRALNLGGKLQPTPNYNTSILEDMFLEENAEFVKETFSGWKELGDALILLKVWARQRSSIYVHDCLNGFLISIILSYLVAHNKLNKSMSAMVIFRITLDFIAASQFWNRGLYFPPKGQKRIPKEAREQYDKMFPVVICDSSNHVNLAFRMTSVGIHELENEAAATLKCIEKCRDNGYENIFATRVDYPGKYDHLIRLSLKGNKEVYELGFCLDDECWRMYEQNVYSLLHQGLSDRAKLIRVTWRNTLTMCDIETGLSGLDVEPLLIGISISSLEKAYRKVDVCPNPGNKEEALMFQKFWGEKAELRKFVDGTITECTVWETDEWNRHSIMKRIISYLLEVHLDLREDNVLQIVDQLDFPLLHAGQDPVLHTRDLLGAFEELSKRLRNIKDIPLRVASVQPLDPAFRCTSVYPPGPHPLAKVKVDVRRLRNMTPSCIQPLEVMIQLEGSGNWPMDDVSIEKTKSAFLLKIAESLENSSRVACSATEEEVDVFMEGFAFRLRIMHEKGLNVIKRGIGSYQMKWVSPTDRKLFIHSQHASMIDGFNRRYTIFGPIVRLAKRWVASHLFSACLVEEAVELMVAYLFLKPLPFDVPCSRVTGFLRFLRLLAEYEWTFYPLIVDINNDLTQSDEKEINDNFLTSRKTNEGNHQIASQAMFLGTSYDKKSEAWTRFSPNPLELKRLVAYARSSANLLTNLILQNKSNSYGWECLFRTPLSNYDAVILLHRDKLPYPQHLLFASEMNHGRHVAHGNPSNAFCPFMSRGDMESSLEELKRKVMVNFDPLRCFVGDVEKEYPDTLKLWYDSLGGDAVGITWEQSKKRKRDESDDEAKPPVEVLKAIGRLGKGFVRDVYLLKAPVGGN